MNSQLLAHVDTFNDNNNNNNNGNGNGNDDYDDGNDNGKDDGNESRVRNIGTDTGRENIDCGDGVEVDHDDRKLDDPVGNDEICSHSEKHKPKRNDTTATIILVVATSILSFVAGTITSSLVEGTLSIQHGLVVPIVILMLISIIVAALFLLKINKKQRPSSEMDSESSKIERETHDETKESQLDECRMNVSRILGLIGSPPLQWTETAIDKTNATPKNGSVRQKLRHRRRRSNDNRQLHHDDYAIMCKYFEAHAQLLLGVDESYYWIKVTSGLHLGLGPRSQATERAELAAISRRRQQKQEGQQRQHGQQQNQEREIEQTNTTSSSMSDATNANAGTTATTEQNYLPLSPQHRIDRGTILSLTSTRRSVARILSEQTKSIVTLYRLFIHEHNNSKTNFVIFDEYDDDDLLLTVPDIVDLAWIKAARKHVGRLLTDCANVFLMMRCMNDELQRDLQSSKLFFQQVENSIGNAERAREYIRSNILSTATTDRRDSTDSLSSAIPLGGSSTQRTQKLIPYLIQHQEKIEGLDAAMKIIYEYHFHRHQANDQEGRKNTYQESDESSVVRWWDEAKHWSAAILAVERGIDGRFFAQHQSSKSSETIDDAKNLTNDMAKNDRKDEASNYEFNKNGGNGTRLTGTGRSSNTTTKTVVFKGKGAIEPRSSRRSDARTQNNSGTGGGGGPSYDAVDRSRDVMTVQMFVEELHKRVLSLLPAEEDVEEHETEEIEEPDIVEVDNDDFDGVVTNSDNDASVQSIHEEDSKTNITTSSSTPVAFIPTGLDGATFLSELQQVSFLDQDERETNDSQHHIFE